MWKKKKNRVKKIKDRSASTRIYPRSINIRNITNGSSETSGKKRSKAGTVFIYALAAAALGGGGYLVYDKIRKRKYLSPSVSDGESSTASYSLPTPKSITSGNAKQAGDSFPLKRGSRGSRVTQLQQALSKTTPGISVDGQFGPATAAALKAAGYGETVSQSTFEKIVGLQGQLSIVFNPGNIADNLYRAAQGKDIGGTLDALKQIKAVGEYSAVNDLYKKHGFISKTIVTDLLDFAFKGNLTAQDQVRHEFLRIGLKVNDEGTWSLQGIKLYRDLITLRETVVTDSKNNKIPVSKATILGDEVKVSSGITWFKSIDGSVLRVPTQDVKYT